MVSCEAINRNPSFFLPHVFHFYVIIIFLLFLPSSQPCFLLRDRPAVSPIAVAISPSFASTGGVSFNIQSMNDCMQERCFFIPLQEEIKRQSPLYAPHTAAALNNACRGYCFPLPTPLEPNISRSLIVSTAPLCGCYSITPMALLPKSEHNNGSVYIVILFYADASAHPFTYTSFYFAARYEQQHRNRGWTYRGKPTRYLAIPVVVARVAAGDAVIYADRR